MKRYLLCMMLLTLTACRAAGTSTPPPAGTTGNPAPETSGDASSSPVRVAGTVPAPDFPAGLDWVNVDRPLTLADLEGKIVLIDFWTYGCINCIHMFPVLAELEAKYAEELVVIGVHSAKFENEGQTENISQIVQRYDLHHPVINDRDFLVWQTYGVNAWPSFALIDPKGDVLAIDSGEIPFEAFDQVIGGMVAYFESIDGINHDPLALTLEGAGDPNTPLRFPGSLLVDEAGGRIFITDSNHHRIVVADLATFEVLDVIGSGRPGLVDGGSGEARFNKPQGLALDGETLYIADTNNHAIRATDLSNGEVSTLYGSGVRGNSFPTFGQPVLPDYDLRSPWGLALGDDGSLYIGMAGTHQLWTLDLDTGELFSSVGSGREALSNGSLADAALAQPSGLAYADGLLYFADSESSSIRVADLYDGEVRTLAGPAENTLFDFGDVDGPVGASRLQHPLDVTLGEDGTLYLVDTYNSRIKAIDTESATITTIFGLGGAGGYRDGGADVAQFDEPGGIAYADGRLYVADTNNHAIRVIDLEAGTVTTAVFPNPEVLRITPDVMVVAGNSAADPDILLPAQEVGSGAGTLTLNLTLPEGFKINSLIDSTVIFTSEGKAVEIALEDSTQVVDSLTVSIPVTFAAGSDTLQADLTLYYCRDGEEGVCLIEQALFQVPVTVRAGGGAAVDISHTVILPAF